MTGLSEFLEKAIHMGAIQLPPLADVIRFPPLVKTKEINKPETRPVSQNNETDEERAAILEYCGGYPRAEAERLARIEIYGDKT